MLSIFKSNPSPRKDPLYQISLSGGSESVEAVLNKVPAGVILRVPVTMVMGSKVREAMVRSFLSTEQVRQIADMVGATKTVTVTEKVVVNDPAIKRPKKCKHGHRQISENVIHWPNGNEDCRICYFEWKGKRGGQA